MRPASTQSLTTSSWKPVADGPKQFPVCIRALLSQHLKSGSIILHFPCVHERDPRLDSMKFMNTWDRVKVVLSKQLVLSCVGCGATFGGHNNDQNGHGCVQLMASHAHSCHTCVQTTGQYLSKGACRRGWPPWRCTLKGTAEHSGPGAGPLGFHRGLPTPWASDIGV